MGRVFTDPFELGVISNNLGGWTTAGTWECFVAPRPIRKDPSGNGGLRSYGSLQIAAQTALSPVYFPGMREGWTRCGVYKPVDATSMAFEVRSSDSQIGWQYTASETFAIRRNGATIATSAATYGITTMYLAEFFFYADNAAGLAEVKIDNVSAVSFGPGDTLGGADAAFTRIYLETVAANAQPAVFDDIAVNSMTILYDNGNGNLPVAGETITGGTSGATATITTVRGTGVSGTLTIHRRTGSFMDNEVLSSSGTFVGEVNAPTMDFTNGLEPNSSWCGNGFVVYLTPTGVGAYTELTSSSGLPNWDNVDEVPVTSANFNEATVVNRKDSYAKSSLPISALSVSAITPAGMMASDLLGVNNREMLVIYGGVDAYGPVVALPSSSQFQFYIFNTAPDGTGYIQVAGVNASEVGVRFT